MAFQFPLTDGHVHPDFSIDAAGSIDEYCTRAVEIGLAELIFTTHFDTNPDYPNENVMVIEGKRVPADSEAMRIYAEAVWDAKRRYHDLGLMVKCGVEVDFYHGLERGRLEVLDNPMFEYLLAAVHRIGDLCLGYRNEALELFAARPLVELLEEYYSLVRQAAKFGVFDAIAHLDYYRLFAPEAMAEDCLRVDFDFVPETLDVLAETGTAMEVNTSSLRHGHREYYPSIGLLNMARKAGVSIRYIGSDAHSPEQLAYDFENAEIIVYETNIHDIHEG